MANFETLKTAIDANINTNGKQAITGSVVNNVMHQMVDATSEQLTELESKTIALSNQSEKITPQYVAGKGVDKTGALFASDSYAYFAPILIKSGEGIVLNDWEDTYLGENVSVIYQCDEQGFFQKPLLLGSGNNRLAIFENTTTSDIYVGVSCRIAQFNYRIGTILSINREVKKNTEIIRNCLAKNITLSDLGIRRKNYYIQSPTGTQRQAERGIITNAIYLDANDEIEAYTGGDGFALIAKSDIAPSDDTIYEVIKTANNITEAVRYVVKKAGYYSFSGRNEDLLSDCLKINIHKYIDSVDTQEEVNVLINGQYKKIEYSLDDLIHFGALEGYYLNNVTLSIQPSDNTVVTQPIYLSSGDEVKCSTGGSGIMLFTKIDSATIDTTTTGFVSVPQYRDAVEYEDIVKEDGWYVFSGRINRTDGTNLLVSIKTSKQITLGLAEQLNNKADKSNNVQPYPLGTGLSEGADFVKDVIPSSPWFDFVENDGTTYGTYLDDKIDSVPQGDSFIFITDAHYGHNKKESARLIDYVRRRLGIKTIIHGGDVLLESPTKADAAKEWLDFNRDYVFRIGTDFKQACGDHDHNGRYASTGQALSYQFIQRCMNGYNIKELVYDTLYDQQVNEVATKNGWTEEERKEYNAWKKMHYYFDDSTINTRFVVLHTGWTGDVGLAVDKLGSAVLDERFALYLQMDFLYNALISCPNESNVVIVGHNVMINPKYTISTENGDVARYDVNELNWIGQWEQVVKMANAFKEKTSVALSYRDWSGKGLQVKSFSFLKATSVPNKIICIGGDVHWDILGKYSNGELQVVKKATLDNIITTEGIISKSDILLSLTLTDGSNDSYRGIIKPPQADYNDTTDSALLMQPHAAGTLDAQAFDIVTLTEDAIYFTRIGGGKDRKVDIGG